MGDIAHSKDYATHGDWLAAIAPGTGLRPEYAMWVHREMFGDMERELRQLRGAVEAIATLRAYIANIEGEGPIRYIEALALCDSFLDTGGR